MTDLDDRLATLSPAKRALLEKLRLAQRAPQPIPRIPDGPAPLSAEQRRLWYVLQLAAGYPVYTVPIGLRLRGAVDVGAMAGALRDLVARHEALRTAFRESAGVPVQQVGDGSAFAPEIVDLRGDEWVDEEATYQGDAFARRTFDYGRGEPFRARLLRLAGDDIHLLLAFHHLAGDGWSAGVMLRDLGELYAARLAGRAPSLPALPLRFRDWAAWQQRPDAPPPADDEAYWRAALAGAPRVLELPTDHPRPPLQSWDGAKHAFELPAGLVERLRETARRERATLFAVVAAAFALLLRRYAGEDDLLLGTLLANRPRPELEHLVGFFANTVPLRVRLDGDPTVGELARRAHAAAVGAQEHASLPFDRVVEIADVAREFSRPPLVQAVLTFADSPASSLVLDGVAVEPLPLDPSIAIFDLTLGVEDRGATLSCLFQYATRLFDGGTIRRMADHFVAVLHAFADDAARPVSHIRLAGEEEASVVAKWGRAEDAAASVPCIHQRFEARARETPDRPALVFGGETVTYAELDRRADRIARALRRRGVGPEARVAVCLERTPSLVAALLAVLKAGGAYVPLDPHHPAARHEAVLRLARPALVVAGEASRAGLSALPDLRLTSLAALEAEDGNAPPSIPIAPENLAYVIFTSGSTGGPKGVEVEHRSAAALVEWMRGVVTDEERSAVLGSTAATFDVSVGEVWGTLCWGGTLVMVENTLSALPPAPAVRAAAMVPTAAAELLREGRFPATVSTVLLGGEPVPLALARDLHALPAVERVLNLYGPTEDTVYSTWAELEAWGERVTIGRPIAGGRAYVLDERLRHTGVGVPGELWLAGAGMARGYAGRPALTAERFVPDPHGPPGSRMYRTLDRARWRDDARLDYLGRADAQVKVRGYRIELEEVEQALAAHPAVAEAAAAARPDADGVRRLAAFLVSACDARPSPADLRAWVRERLPEYMAPGAFAWVEALPRTGSGKLDRRALPEVDEPAAARTPYVAPRSATEAKVAALWAEVLGVDRVGVEDDFFDLGGQSILATRLVARVRAELGADVAVAELLTGPTVERMARRVEGKDTGVRLPLVPLQGFGDRPPLFLAHPAGGHVVCYRGLAILLAPEQPVYALQPRGVEDGETPIDRVEEMAARYVAAIRQLRPRGPYRLGGWSFGGVLAWEMARQLEAGGAEVDLLALFDTAPTSMSISYDPGDPADVVWQTVAGLAGHAAAARVDVETLRGLEPREQVLAMIRGMDLPRLFPESRADDVLALTAVRAANLRAQTVYRPGDFGGHLTYFRTAGSDDAEGNSPGTEYWSSLARGGTTVHAVGGTHGTILNEPYVEVLVEAILAEGRKKC